MSEQKLPWTEKEIQQRIVLSGFHRWLSSRLKSTGHVPLYFSFSDVVLHRMKIISECRKIKALVLSRVSIQRSWDKTVQTQLNLEKKSDERFTRIGIEDREFDTYRPTSYLGRKWKEYKLNRVLKKRSREKEQYDFDIDFTKSLSTGILSYVNLVDPVLKAELETMRWYLKALKDKPSCFLIWVDIQDIYISIQLLLLVVPAFQDDLAFQAVS